MWKLGLQYAESELCCSEHGCTGMRGQGPGLAEESRDDAAARGLVSKNRAAGDGRQGQAE